MLTIAGAGLALIAFRSAIYRPNVVRVSAQDATSMVAPGAAALAHSASRIASSSSEFTPGEAQLFAPAGGRGWTVVSAPVVYCASPNTLRKVVQSDVR